MKRKIYKILYVIILILFIISVINLISDYKGIQEEYGLYGNRVTALGMKDYILIRGVFFVLPSSIIFLIAKILKRKWANS